MQQLEQFFFNITKVILMVTGTFGAIILSGLIFWLTWEFLLVHLISDVKEKVKSKIKGVTK